MVSRVRPVDVNVVFDDRPYKLGETMNLTVEMTPRGEVEVRETRVDLECEEHYREISTVMVAVNTGPLAGISRQPVPRVPKQIIKEHRETFAHSSVVFLEDTRLDAGMTDMYNVRFEIQPEPPPHATNATVTWRLVTTIDVARSRDIRTRQRVKVTLA